MVVSGLAEDYARALLQRDDVDFTITYCTTAADALRQYSGEQVVLGDPDLVAPILSNMPNVNWVQSTWAGVLPFIDAPRRDYSLTGVKQVFGAQMSEYVIGHILAHELKITDRESAQGKREWLDTPSGTLQHKRIGIMGTGSIGQHIARNAATFGMSVSGLNRSGTPVSGFTEVIPVGNIDEFLSPLDYLVSVLPETPDTHDLLNEHTLSRLPEHAWFINVGRGNVLDEPALIQALEAGRLAGAVLDVFKQEPLPSDSALWSTKNLRVTAHTAAVSDASLIIPIFMENLRRYRAGEQLKYVVEFDRGY